MRKMIIVLSLTLALLSLFGLTAAVMADPPPSCPDGQHYDQQSQQCVDNGPPEEPTAEPTTEPTAEQPTATAVVDPTATDQGPESRAYCHATSDPSGTHYQYLFNPAWVQHFENNGTPKDGHELDFFTFEGNTDCVRDEPTDDPTATEIVEATATDVIEPTATEEGQPTATEEGRPTPTDDCIPGGGTEFAPCATVTPKPPSHPGTGPEESSAVLGWLTTMGIGLASAGIAGMRRR
ncbi:MAG TPA: hypothetical protein VJK02_21260 [Anaerolineales bacterium]|nr:hypothetical protein [Anaerolineales bacterium]